MYGVGRAMARATKAQQRVQKRAEQEERKKAEARRSAAKTIAIVGGLVVAVVVALVLLWPEPQVGNTTAEAWDLPELDGEGRVALADFSGKPTVAAFFASWCEVCEEEIPQYLAVSREVAGEVNFVGINTQDSGRGLGDAEKWGIAEEWPLARDIGNANGSGLSTSTFGMRGSPLTVFYDENGSVLHVQRGGLTGTQLIEAMAHLFGVEV